MKNSDVFNAWIHLTKYHDRILKAIDYRLHDRFQMGTKEFYLLYYLEQSEQGKMSLSGLVPKVGLSHSALSRLVTRLEKHKDGPYIKRQTNMKDKRSVAIVLMKKGEMLVSEMQTLIDESLQTQLVEKDIIHIKRLIQ